jgi:uncharacterized membrane protein
MLKGREPESRPSPLSVTEFTEFELRKGPIPDATELARYAEAHPGAPGVILSEFRNQATHRREMERKALALDRRALEGSIQSERLGIFCALAIALVGFGCATFLIATDHGIAGTVVFGLDVTALASAFILGRPQSRGGEV